MDYNDIDNFLLYTKRARAHRERKRERERERVKNFRTLKLKN